MKNNRIAGVIGSGSNPHRSLSEPLGRFLAEKGYHLVNGGGGGVMQAVAEAFQSVKNKKGFVVGVVPSSEPCDTAEDRKHYQVPPGYPNAFTEITVRTHLHLSGSRGKKIASRNHIEVLTADFIIALPGSAGTRSEIELALEYGKPIILLSPNGELEEFSEKATLVKTVEETKDWIHLKKS